MRGDVTPSLRVGVRVPWIGDLGYRGGLAGEFAADTMFDQLIRILWTRKQTVCLVKDFTGLSVSARCGDTV